RESPRRPVQLRQQSGLSDQTELSEEGRWSRNPDSSCAVPGSVPVVLQVCLSPWILNRGRFHKSGNRTSAVWHPPVGSIGMHAITTPLRFFESTGLNDAAAGGVGFRGVRHR